MSRRGGPASHLGSAPPSHPVSPRACRSPGGPPSQPGLAAAAGLALRPRAGCQHPRVLTALLLGGPAAAPRLLQPSRGPCRGTSLGQGLRGLAAHSACPRPSSLPGSWGARRDWGVPLQGVPPCCGAGKGRRVRGSARELRCLSRPPSQQSPGLAPGVMCEIRAPWQLPWARCPGGLRQQEERGAALL